jgi:ATP-dependent DNA ligase
VLVAPLAPPPTTVPELVAPVVAVSPLDSLATLPLLVMPLSETLPEEDPLAGGTFVEAPLGDEAPVALEPEPFAPTAPFEDAVGSALLHALARQTALINVKALVRRMFRPAIAHRTSATIRYTLKTLPCARKPSYAKKSQGAFAALFSNGAPMNMQLPIRPPLLPMLAKRLDRIPDGDGWIFEPKWDGFRVVVFRDHDELLIQSRDEKPLDRYFPELAAPLKATLPDRCVVDGEVVVAKGSALDFEALQLRIHPAASRIKLLASEIPASVVLWDLLCVGERSLLQTPFRERRQELASLLAHPAPSIHLTPATSDRHVAADWFERFEGAGLDGVMAKAEGGAYEPNKRAMFKVKHERDCDCVVAGFRWHKDSNQTAVGSLLLGLHDDSGQLHHVGVAASFTAEKRRQLVSFLEPYRARALEDHPWRAWAGDEITQRMPGGKSRWSQGKDLSWEPLRPELVVEVAYDHLQSGRFRHTAQFRRWRSDKKPTDCTYAELEVVAPHELAAIFRA